MKNAQIVPPAIETVRVPFADSSQPAIAGPQMEKHGRSHRSPAQARPRPHRLVDVLDRCDTGFHQVDRLAPDSGLKSVGDMAGHLAVDADGHLSDGGVEPLR